MKKISQVLFTLFVLGVAGVVSAQAETALVAAKVAAPPVLDGKAKDEAWSQAQEIKVRDRVAAVDVALRALYTDDQVFFLVSYPTAEESRLHKPWVWNKSLESYVPGPQREDVFNFKWNMMEQPVDLSNFSDDSYRADVWYWKAGRTDPAGYADDQMHLLSDSGDRKSQETQSATGRKRYLTRIPDAGDSAAESRLLTDYEGDVVDQFQSQAPSGSRADVKARGEWKEGVWTIEFARKLNTGQEDDLRFDPASGKDYLFGISVYGLYGEPLAEKGATSHYGKGRISEPLLLKFSR